ncbi:hypothetical protein QQX09_03530 [Demequina sp. SYSU T00192]|uniref:SPW repeat-containing protein n=1 Tax=Demequina litoralis TaxID=3051660 RepID=A0ABT8G720_9MICO|nr:hypothetical protein [Demequina sp. SYSU T00192]MDN4474925.1 hypothetical protein [Demequina sp. SYSU T00192]
MAALGVAAEAAGMAVAAVAYAIHAASLPEPAFAVGLAAFFGLTAAGLLLVARSLHRGARWAVSAALTWQALQTLAGINLTGVRPALGVPVAALGVLVGIAVLVAGRPALRPSGD